MTRKDYIRFAAMLKGIGNSSQMMNNSYYGLISFDRDQLNYLAAKHADIFEADNPRFDRKRFMRACGIDTWKK